MPGPPLARPRELQSLVVVASLRSPNARSWRTSTRPTPCRPYWRAWGNQIHAQVLGKMPGAAGPPTLTEICKQLTADRYTVLHLVCHGDFLARTARRTSFSTTTRADEPVPATEVIKSFRPAGGRARLPHFAFLSVCDSAKPAAEGALGGPGATAGARGGPAAVVAMTEKISQATALELGKAFTPTPRAREGRPGPWPRRASRCARASDVVVPVARALLVVWAGARSSSTRRRVAHGVADPRGAGQARGPVSRARSGAPERRS